MKLLARLSRRRGVPAAVTFNARQTAPWSGQSAMLIEDLEDIGYRKYAVVVLAGTEKGAQNLADLLSEKGVKASYETVLEKAAVGRVYVMPGILSAAHNIVQTSLIHVVPLIVKCAAKCQIFV